ncbi:hypothetical protein [Deinococcus ruber]|uniref:Uncharacterized protein n=1 Tax=Deinococcus ruber TaxID=1848197 RepID=A0A918CEQ7_9DEIO|nr:hypothetical protein [Deinococcus ruber]GGR20188.1 hypothetical protein GCM10008957_35750 [Deinococcus ruber]
MTRSRSELWLTADELEEIYRLYGKDAERLLARLEQALLESFEQHREMSIWLHRRHPGFNARPVQLLLRGQVVLLLQFLCDINERLG